MPPNFITTPESGNVNFVDGPKENGQGTATVSRGNPGLATVRSLTTLMAHVLIGIITGAAILFAFRNGTPLNATNQHLILCTIGYQFLMSEAILCLAPDSWLSSLSLKHKRWVHWVLQVLGSVLALAGCFVKIADKDLHWTSLHGRFALVSMVFTSVSLVNGLASMYAYEVRRFIPGILSRLSHICFGIVALGSASIALAYGFDKNSFRIWATTRLTDTLIIMVGAFTTIVIINPCITFYTKLSSSLRN